MGSEAVSPSFIVPTEPVHVSTSNAILAATASKASPSMDTDELTVYWLDIALLCVVGAFFLAGLPRLLGRIARLSEWTQGLILRKGPPSARYLPPTRPRALSTSNRLRRQNTDATLADKSSNQSHTYAAHDIYSKGGKAASAMPRRINSPAHIPALSTLLHPLSALFSHPVDSGISMGKFILLVLYTTSCIAVTFIMSGKPLTDSVRLGWIATSQIPVAIALGTKNNLVGMLVGMGYEKLNFFHRCVGTTVFIFANLHAVGYLYKWAFADTLATEFSESSNIHGLVSLIGVEMLYFGSAGFIRRRAYPLFLSMHVVGNILLLASLCHHKAGCVNWVLIAGGIYVLDHLVRLVKSRVCTARISTVPELGVTRVELPTIRKGWRAGQHVRLRVLSMEMGGIGWSVAHPFTIANVSDSASGQGLVLLVKKAGRWTNNLYEAANRAGYYASEEGYEAQRDMRVIVEGPYGGLGNMVMSSFSAAVLVAGGSGITFALSQAEDLVTAVREGKSALKSIDVIWITQDVASLSPLIPTFSAMIESIAPIPGVLLKISVFCSRAYARPMEKDSSTSAYIASLEPSLSVQAGRPALPRMLDATVRRTSALQHARGVAVGVCGPAKLAEDVQMAGREIESELRSACGGLEIHEEVFGW
ncbi:hypothetical protein M0805_007970 [Coniferiporia weirii]|nr:hypothetical protein M0805_007970 [Coniferiporia weirii]